MVAMSAAQAGMYRWVDADGSVHYSDSPPPAGAKNVQQKNFGDNVIESGELPYSVQQAAKNFPVTLYANDCDVCGKARQLLAKRGIPYTSRGAERPEEQDALRQITGGSLVVPVLVVGKIVLRGYEEGQWNSTLSDAGYPLTKVIAKPIAPAEVKPAPAAAPSAAPAAAPTEPGY
jgi:glutaredoxin